MKVLYIYISPTMLAFCRVDLEVEAFSSLFTRRGRCKLRSQARTKFHDQSITLVGVKEHEELLPTYKQAMANDKSILYGRSQVDHQECGYL
jgi:hypothetical protein